MTQVYSNSELSLCQNRLYTEPNFLKTNLCLLVLVQENNTQIGPNMDIWQKKYHVLFNFHILYTLHHLILNFSIHLNLLQLLYKQIFGTL